MEIYSRSPNACPLVSIIVPAYNVELYIEKCLVTLLEQTYQNIEIIVVNDGSTDQTAAIIEKMAERDARIRTFHQKNMGVSVSRNVGMDAACGEYLVFVDGDDFLSHDYVKYMVDMVESTHVDFGFSVCCFTRSGESQTKAEQIRVVSSDEATALLLSPDVVVGCWNKIYRKEFVLNHQLRFSPDLFYGEGLSFITSAAQHAPKVAVGNRKVYYYRKNNQASATTVFSIQKIYNGEKALNHICHSVRTDYDRTRVMLLLHICLFRLSAMVRLHANNIKKVYSADYKRWKDYVRKHLVTLVFSKHVSAYRKLMLCGGYLCPRLVGRMDEIRRKKIAQNSINDL